MSREKRALLIVHAWIEQGSDRPLRAHVRATADVDAGFEIDLTLSDIDLACNVVRDWLGRVAASSNDADTDADPAARDASES